MNHERIEELLAVRALGGLDGSDVGALERELASHGDCAECRRLEDGFAETAARLADVLPAEPVSPGMVQAILSAQRPILVAVPDAPAADEPMPAGDGRPERLFERNRRRNSWRTAVALAAAFALVMVTGALGLRFQRSIHVSSAALTQRVVRFQGPTGSLIAAYTPGETGAVLFGSGLPKLGHGKVYEIWTITNEQPASAGCASSSDGSLQTSVTVDIGHAQLLAVTVEPAACPAAPTTTPILTAPITV